MNLTDLENAHDKLPQRLNQPRPMSIAKDGGTKSAPVQPPQTPVRVHRSTDVSHEAF